MNIQHLLSAFAPCLIAFSCSCGSQQQINTNGSKPDGAESVKSVARFDFFSYRGMDDYYLQHALPADDYFYNPILPGWYSDPSICTNGEDYFMVTSTFCYFPGVPIFHSKDLVNWKQVGHVLDRASQLVNMKNQGISGGIFAPAIEYNPHNRTYYMITTNVGAGNFFVKTQDPFGAWSDPIMLPDVQGIDPSFFFDEDGKAYIVNNDEPVGGSAYDGHRAIKVQEFDVVTDKTVGERIMIVNGGARPEDKPIWIEGPHLYKIKGTYYLMSAEGGTSGWHSEVIFKGESPVGPFTPWDKNPILTQRTLNVGRQNPVTCAGHADLVQAKNGDWWAVFLACRPIDNDFENLGRETFMMPVRWSEDGFPYMTQGDELVPLTVQCPGISRSIDITFGNFDRMNNFNDNQLGLEWMTLRSSASELYSLTEAPGFLSLHCADVNSSEKGTPAFVCRRMQHHKFECITQMDFIPATADECAGLLLFKDDAHQYLFSVKKADAGTKICVEKISGEGAKILDCKYIDKKIETIGLKVVSEGTSYHFYYALEDKVWKPVSLNIDAKYLSTANAGGFTGTTIGMYASKKPF